MVKPCVVCGEAKLLEDFHRLRSAPDGARLLEEMVVI